MKLTQPQRASRRRNCYSKTSRHVEDDVHQQQKIRRSKNRRPKEEIRRPKKKSDARRRDENEDETAIGSETELETENAVEQKMFDEMKSD